MYVSQKEVNRYTKDIFSTVDNMGEKIMKKYKLKFDDFDVRNR